MTVASSPVAQSKVRSTPKVRALPKDQPLAKARSPKGLLSLVYLGEGIFAVHSIKYSKKGNTEAVYPIYANGLICPCPAIVHARERTGICKHLRLVCDYLAGGPDSLELF
jgi:hypothetical protein